MSISSLGAAEVPVGSLGGDSVSEGGSADSLFIRDIHERREQKRQELEKGDTESDDDEAGGLIHDLLRHFRYCCANRKKGRFASSSPAAAAAAANGGPAVLAAAAGKGPARAKTYSVSGSSSSSSTATRNALVDKYIGDKAHLVAWRIVLGQAAGHRRGLAPGEGPSWGAPGEPGGPPILTSNKAAWAACTWCVRLENNERMTGKMIGEILAAAETQKGTLDIMHAIEETVQFKTLLFVRRVDGPNPEDVLGDFNSMFLEEIHQSPGRKGVSPGGAIYAVLHACRVVALYIRRHGELIDYAAFNVMPNEKELFPPSFMGFKS